MGISFRCVQGSRGKGHEVASALNCVDEEQSMLRPFSDPRIGARKRIIEIEEVSALRQCHQLTV